MKKKIAGLSLLICTMLCLCGCDSTEKDYNSAEKLFESGEYKEALELYSQIGDYEDSVEKIAICEKEIAMRENADYDFLEAIEKSVLGRMTASDNEDYANLVNTELVYLEEFQWTLDEYEMWCIVNNNTDYEFSTVYEISFYNSDGIMFESTQAYIPNIKPHSSYKVYEYIND